MLCSKLWLVNLSPNVAFPQMRRAMKPLNLRGGYIGGGKGVVTGAPVDRSPYFQPYALSWGAIYDADSIDKCVLLWNLLKWWMRSICSFPMDPRWSKYLLPWEPKTFMFRGYDPYIEGLKPSCFMVLGSKGKRFTPPNCTLISAFLAARILGSIGIFHGRIDSCWIPRQCMGNNYGNSSTNFLWFGLIWWDWWGSWEICYYLMGKKMGIGIRNSNVLGVFVCKWL